MMFHCYLFFFLFFRKYVLYPNLLSQGCLLPSWETSSLALLPPRSFLWRVISQTSMTLNMIRVWGVLGSLKLLERSTEKAWWLWRSLQFRIPRCLSPAINKSWRNWKSGFILPRTVCLSRSCWKSIWEGSHALQAVRARQPLQPHQHPSILK